MIADLGTADGQTIIVGAKSPEGALIRWRVEKVRRKKTKLTRVWEGAANSNWGPGAPELE